MENHILTKLLADPWQTKIYGDGKSLRYVLENFYLKATIKSNFKNVLLSLNNFYLEFKEPMAAIVNDKYPNRNHLLRMIERKIKNSDIFFKIFEGCYIKESVAFKMLGDK